MKIQRIIDALEDLHDKVTNEVAYTHRSAGLDCALGQAFTILNQHSMGAFKTEEDKTYEITILWGESPEDDAEPKTYSFKTKAELEAFKLGINEMDGWQGWDIVSQDDHADHDHDDHSTAESFVSQEGLNELDKQENEQIAEIHYERFRKLMYEDWNENAIKKAWDIMESKPYEEWEPLLKKHVTREMDRGDIPWIMKYYNDARAESECNE